MGHPQAQSGQTVPRAPPSQVTPALGTLFPVLASTPCSLQSRAYKGRAAPVVMEVSFQSASS